MKLHWVGAAALVLLSSGCVRPTGDFGRASPNVLNDGVMPTLGAARASLNGEPVSSFNQTDEERDMADRLWRFLIAPHAHDWFYNVATELRRTRLSDREIQFSPIRYYEYLSRDEYRSSPVRYSRLEEDIKADIAMLPSAFAAVCAVMDIDHQRSVALRNVSTLSSSAEEDVAARRAENQAVISWFTRAVRYRYQSYSYALDQLLVETPHPEAREADQQLTLLEPYVVAGEQGQFCGFAGGRNAQNHGSTITGRVLMSGTDGNYRR